MIRSTTPSFVVPVDYQTTVVRTVASMVDHFGLDPLIVAEMLANAVGLECGRFAFDLWANHAEEDCAADLMADYRIDSDIVRALFDSLGIAV